MTTEHTPEPWAIGWSGDPDVEGRAVASPLSVIAGTGAISDMLKLYRPWDEVEANADRIVTCVNYCEGINPEAVPDLLAACKATVEMFCVKPDSTLPDDIKAQMTTMFQRDPTCQQVLAAIAKAERKDTRQ